MSKKALLVGINYTGTPSALRGCLNDVYEIESVLKNNFKFSNIKKILDHDATTNAIYEGLYWLIDNAKSGDILYFHYSGHGSQIVDQNHDEPDRLDEIICPVDINWRDKVIRDDALAHIFSKLPKGVHLTVTLDCCNSGTGLRGTMGNMNFSPKEAKNRWMPTPIFMAEAIKRYNLTSGKKGLFLTEDRKSDQQAGILISGCKSNQTSADAWIPSKNKFMGACTYYLIDMLQRHKYKIDYAALVRKMNHFLQQNGYSQQPQLNCNPKSRHLNFLKQ